MQHTAKVLLYTLRLHCIDRTFLFVKSLCEFTQETGDVLSLNYQVIDNYHWVAVENPYINQ